MAWVIGAAVSAALLAQVVLMIGIGIAEASAIAFRFTEQVGVPVFAGILSLAVLAYAVFIHLIVRAIGRSVEVPWVIWPAMAALPTVWVFIVLADATGALQAILAIMQLVGIAIAFVTLGDRRWTKTEVPLIVQRPT
ncbi:MAG: hypothetical protein JXA36_06625 [Coriobacteriia bacterium]|nr:hypothetical protein [Coriobacteriia bacterium]